MTAVLANRAGILLLGFLLGLGLTGCVGAATLAPESTKVPPPTAVSTPTRTATPRPSSTPVPTPTPALAQIPFEQLKNMAVAVSYDDLFRTNELYLGQLVYYRAKVIQVLEEAKDNYQLRADVTQGEYSWSDTVYLRYYGPRFLENDVIEFVGKSTGLVKYQAIFGNEVTIPGIIVVQARLVAKAADPTPTPAPTATASVLPTATPTPQPGFSRGNPAIIGTELFIKVEALFDNYEARVTLLEIIRGEQAWQQLRQANMFNSPPQAGFEYILARIRFDYLKGKDPNIQYDLSSYDFDAVSSGGKDYVGPFVVEPKPTISAKLYPGASHEGWVAFQVAQQDTRPLMTFGRDNQGRNGLWWKLYK